MSRTLQTSTVYVSAVSYLFECNANDTYILRMTQFVLCSRAAAAVVGAGVVVVVAIVIFVEVA